MCTGHFRGAWTTGGSLGSVTMWYSPPNLPMLSKRSGYNAWRSPLFVSTGRGTLLEHVPTAQCNSTKLSWQQVDRPTIAGISCFVNVRALDRTYPMLGYLGAIVCSQFGLTRCCFRGEAIFIRMAWKHVPINSQRQNVSYFHFRHRVRMINIRQFYLEHGNCQSELSQNTTRVRICLFNCVDLVLTGLGLWYSTPRLLPKWRLGFPIFLTLVPIGSTGCTLHLALWAGYFFHNWDHISHIWGWNSVW